MNNNYPVRKGQGSSLVPSFRPNNNYRIPSNIIPTRYGTKGRNIAGQIKTRIHLKNKYGEEMDIYQTQQVLNLLNNNHSTWIVGGNSTNRNYRRKR